MTKQMEGYVLRVRMRRRAGEMQRGQCFLLAVLTGLEKCSKKGALLLDGIPLSFFDGLVLKHSFKDSDGPIDLVGWADLLGLDLNERILVMDRMSLNEC